MSEPANYLRFKKGLRLDVLDHPAVDEVEYKRLLKAAQLRLLMYQRALVEEKRPLLVIF